MTLYCGVYPAGQVPCVEPSGRRQVQPSIGAASAAVKAPPPIPTAPLAMRTAPAKRSFLVVLMT